jgi:hypothetical protein
MSEREVQHSYTFRQPWRVVARAYLAKYPHPKLSHVESVDTLERYVDQDGNLVSTRILISSFMKFSSVAGLEQSVVDPKAQSITLFTRNLSYTSYSLSKEWCSYIAKEENYTEYILRAKVKASRTLSLLMSPLMSTIAGNFRKGTKVLEDIMYNRMGIPKYSNYDEFADQWNQLRDLKKKLKMLKKSLNYTHILQNAPADVLREIIEILSKQKAEAEVTFRYLKEFADMQRVDELTACLTYQDKKILKEMLEKLKEKFGQTTDEIMAKYGFS